MCIQYQHQPHNCLPLSFLPKHIAALLLALAWRTIYLLQLYLHRGLTVQVKVALCQLHVTADKEQNIATAKAAIEVSAC